ncbi:hypothetical protein [Undibacterium pigrum]|uniref:Uncharacterized protein n=1 Tax=Undibacterium pigrum TaxID=401470 RepID=A0A318IYT5_9BURK|nr:hypothetical protein [Undibacterium pigrum]PXX40364.1 hypothetical protein DFR42_108199 [Undibacterium pigrum]
MKFKKNAILLALFLTLFGFTAYFLFGRTPVDHAKPEVFNADTAMLAIFGTYNDKQQGVLLPEKNTAQWNMKEADTLATALLVATYTEAGKKKAVLAIQRQQILDGVVEQSHATGAMISVYIFAYNGKQWVFEKGKKEVVESGAHGEAPGGSLIRLGQDKYGLLFAGGDVHQGFTNDYAFIISLSEPKPVKLLDLSMGESNSGTCTDVVEEQEGMMQACWESVSKLSFLQNGTDEYYALKLSTTSNKPADGSKQVLEKKWDEYFVRTATGYKASKAQSLKAAKPVADDVVNNAGETQKQTKSVPNMQRQ